jgi:predicted DCC family thiol-disulfide oxidoreductase YuxK
MMPIPTTKELKRPILLFNDECAVCRRIARWVRRSAQGEPGEPSIVERPIGDDPDALRLLNPALDIWDAYATIHLLMPDGSMKVGGEAVAEVLRTLPNTQWFAWSFSVRLFGFRPFQMLLNIAYALLSDVRPLLGCESCGAQGFWVRPLHWMFKGSKSLLDGRRRATTIPHFTALSTAARRA